MEFKRIQFIAFFGLLIALCIGFVYMIWAYIYGLVWAVIIAAISMPMYNFIEKRIKRPSISAGLSVIGVILVVILPLLGVGALVVQEALEVEARVAEGNTVEDVQEFIQGISEQPFIAPVLENIDIEAKIAEFAQELPSLTVGWITAGFQSALAFTVNALIMLYVLYYLYQSGPDWLRRLTHLLPLGDENEEILFKKFTSTAKATLKGTILLGGIQGTLGGIFFWIVGIPSAIFWTLVMIVLSIIPAVGSFLVWFPAAVYLLVTGQYWQSLVLFIGGGIISLLDNLLRPPLVGKEIEMHSVVILLSTLGGLGVLGISGVVLGPMIAAFLMAVISMYEHRYKKQLDTD